MFEILIFENLECQILELQIPVFEILVDCLAPVHAARPIAPSPG